MRPLTRGARRLSLLATDSMAAPTIDAALDAGVQRWVTTSDGLELETASWGVPGKKPETVLFLQGHSGSLSDMHLYPTLVTSLVDAGLNVVAFDFRGMGQARKVPTEGDKKKDWGYEHYASDCLAVLDACAAGRPAHIMGVSWGSFLAQRFAVLYPGRVLSLTPILSAPDLPIQAVSMLSRAPLFSAKLIWASMFRPPQEGWTKERYVEWRLRLVTLSASWRQDYHWPWSTPSTRMAAEDVAIHRRVAEMVWERGAVDWGQSGANLQSHANDVSGMNSREALDKHLRELKESGVGPRTLWVSGAEDALHVIESARSGAEALGSKIVEFEGGHMLGAATKDVWEAAIVAHVLEHPAAGVREGGTF